MVPLAVLAGWACVAGLGLGWWRWIPAAYLVLAYLVALGVKWLLPWWRAGGDEATRGAFERTWRGR